MRARQVVFLASQGNNIIQKTPNIEQFCTILKQHFQASGWSSNSASIETRQKVVHWRNRLRKAKKIVPRLD